MTPYRDFDEEWRAKRERRSLYWFLTIVLVACAVSAILTHEFVPRPAEPALPCVEQTPEQCVDSARVTGPGLLVQCPPGAHMETTRVGSSDAVLMVCTCPRGGDR